MMAIKKIGLLSGLFLFLAASVIAYQYRDNLLRPAGTQLKTKEQAYTPGMYPPTSEFISPWMKEHIETLRKQSLDESFVQLLRDKQFFGYISSYASRTDDLEVMLNSRTFLKVLQQFGELPREQSLEKLRRFSDRAIKEFKDSLDKSLGENTVQFVNLQQGDLPLHASELLTITGMHSPSILDTKYMLCVTMVLAARMGEKELLRQQMDTMQSLVNQFVVAGGYSRQTALVNDECIISILMCALTRKREKLDIDLSPFSLIPRESRGQLVLL